MLLNNNKSGTSQHNPKISVIIPLYNHEKYIKEAICSVLEQSFSDFEVIVINDGSTDNSEDIVRNVNDDRIKYFYQENQGAHNTINRGINLARGDYVSILNSDDIYDSKRLEDCLKMIESDDSLSAVFSHIAFIDDKGEFIKYVKGPEDIWTNHDPDVWREEKNIVLDLLAGNFLMTTSNLFCRKNIFNEVGYFSNLKYTHDYEFFLRICSRFKVNVIEEPLLKYRMHKTNTIKGNEAAVSFEVGLVLSNFFLRCDLFKFLKAEDDIYARMAKFLNSVNTHDSERMIMTLLFFGMKHPDIGSNFSARFFEDDKNPFRNSCIERFKKNTEAWTQWRETNERFIAKEGELQEANERLIKKDKELQDKNEKIIERDDEIQVLRNSISYRLANFMTWPLRKLFGRS
jgi:glycosyltransferase involved in cell wall biosynthesis